jgi:hypothetical protein
MKITIPFLIKANFFFLHKITISRIKHRLNNFTLMSILKGGGYTYHCYCRCPLIGDFSSRACMFEIVFKIKFLKKKKSFLDIFLAF